jgi:hypothetical protein
VAGGVERGGVQGQALVVGHEAGGAAGEVEQSLVHDAAIMASSDGP